VVVGCQSTEQSLAPFNDDALEGYEKRHATTAPGVETITEYPKIESRRPSLVAGSLTTTQPSIVQSLEYQMPDPSVAAEVFEARTRLITDERRARDYRRVCARAVEHLKGLKRAAQVSLSLADVIHRTVANNYTIRVAGYEPAVSTAQIVEAEAQFDATFYASWLSVIQDQPTASELQATNNKAQTAGSGIRKLLSTGTMVDLSFNYQRTKSNLPFQTLNPSINNDFTLKMQQPFLQGFGLDFNRSQINIRKNERKIAVEKFREQIRETLWNVEQAYWQLVQTRRAATITAELLAETEETYRYIEARRDFDAFAVLIANSKAAVDLRRVDLITSIAAVKDAEDAVKALMNDPEITLAKNIEMITVDIPEAVPIVVDRVGEVQTALDNRSELRQRDFQIENARIIVGTAKNQVLPKFDAVFTYKVLGLGGNESSAFEQTVDNRFNEYDVGVQFEWPIGSRKARAALKQAKLRYEQAIASRKAQIEQIILDVNKAVRALGTAWDAIIPARDATLASEENVRATKERAERKSPAELQTELTGQEQLAQARRTLLDALVRYNIAIAGLERSKDTLLRYDNVVIAEPED
jgi:outer membrane protein